MTRSGLNGGSWAKPPSSLFTASRNAASVFCSSTRHPIERTQTRVRLQGICRSLPDFIKLAGRLQQIELRLLSLEISVEVGHPLVVFLEAAPFHFP